MKNIARLFRCLAFLVILSPFFFTSQTAYSADYLNNFGDLSSGNQTSTFSALTPQNNLPQISLASPISGFVKPVHITHAGDGSNRLFVVEQGGRIRLVKNGVLLTTPFLDITTRISPDALMSLAFPPGYASKGYFYIYYVNKCNQPEVARYRITSNPDVADANSGQIVLTVSQQTGPGHVGGLIAFSPRDGYLYLATGDGDTGERNAPGDPENRAQNRSELRGKMLRIDVETGTPATYSIPASNPFVTTPAHRGEIWALGLRNPWRFSFDRQTSDLYIGDNGQDRYEEVDFQPANSTGGENYGWRVMEGSYCYNPPTGCSTTGLTLPIYDYLRTGDCASVIGGFVYRGSTYPRMQGIYFYADYCNGRISGLRRVNGIWENTPLLDTGFNYGVVTFGEDEQGEIYTVHHGNGTIYKIVDNVTTTCTYSISPTSQNFGAAGGTGSVSVTTQTGCNWTAASNQSFVSITSGNSGSGNGTVNYSVAANSTNSTRTATLTIAGLTFTVQQAAAPVTTRTLTVASSNPSSGVSIAVSPNDNNNQGNGITQFTRTYNNNTAVTLVAPETAAGNNFQKWQRNGADFSSSRTVNVTMDADYVMTAVFVAPPACTYSISPTSQNFSSGGGTGSISVTTQSGCGWTANSNASWITINSGSSGTGTGTISFTVAANTGAARTGTITAAGQTFTVNQAAPPPPSASYSAVTDFSATNNPSGAWSYGYKSFSSSTFTSYTSNGQPWTGINSWSPNSGGNCCPLVAQNSTGGIQSYLTITHPIDLLNMHPGENGEWSVVRWTAPATGTYQIRGRFEGIDRYGTTTNVRILHRGVQVWAGNISYYGVQTPFDFNLSVTAGDTIDFEVSYGTNNTYFYDSTGLAAIITPASALTETIKPGK